MFVGSGRYPFGLILPVHDHENVIQAVWNRFMSFVDSRLSLMHKRACQQFGAAWSYDLTGSTVGHVDAGSEDVDEGVH